ncbi:glycosyltransferase family 2 protein [Patescibacteria group bacterium]|nr:glycosyltransferase family 2 protein [Patescibacteria group bacterium]
MYILSIIILSYNTSDLTVGCVKSIIDNYRKEIEDEILEVIVVDNASSDNSVFNLLKINNIKLLRNKTNAGFSKGSNIGAKLAKGDYLLFLNSDTRVSGKGFLQMAEFLKKNKNIGILGGRLLNPDGSLQASGGNFYNPGNLLLMLLGGERLGLIRKKAARKESVDWVSGASMMIKRDLFESLGGFDEYFFMYIEDMELCFRVKKLGLKIYLYPDIRLVHEVHGSSSRTFAIINIYRGILYFYKKHGSFISLILVRFLLETKAVILICLGRLIRNTYLISTYEEAFSSCR